MTVHVSTRYPTARKRHYCGICQRVILPGETYRVSAYMEGGPIGSLKACLHCECVMGAHVLMTDCWCGDEGWDGECELGWLDDEHPEVAAALRAGWRYPDGELLPLPFQTRCACGNSLALRTRRDIANRVVSGLCSSCRMARIATQLDKLADGINRVSRASRKLPS